MGDIGKERKTIEVLPRRAPVPTREPSPAPAPAPAPEKEPAKQEAR